MDKVKPYTRSGERLNEVSMTLYFNLLSLPFLFALAALQGELTTLWEQPDLNNPAFLAVATLTGFVGFAISFVTLWFLSTTTATIFGLVGTLAKIPVAMAGLLLPSGAKGPAFIVFRNFDAIYAYNAAESYALAIAHLSDRLRGAGAFRTPWPTDDPGIGRAERREVQQRLLDGGFDVGAPDGIVGARTRTAIRAFQASAGLAQDGRAGMRVLQALRASTSGAAVAPVKK
jgi:hypothetical protein